MISLIKYEFIRKYKLVSMILITILALNLLLLTKGAGGSMLFLVVSLSALFVFYLVDIIKMYSDDLNKKTGYMLFMTPNSGYKIIWAKLLAAIIEGAGLVLIYFIFILINGAYIVVSMGDQIDYSQIVRGVNQLLSGTFGFNLGHVLVLLMAVLAFLIAFITTVYTAMTIRKSIFSEIKFGGLFSFIIFLLINWLLSLVSDKFHDIMTPYYDSINAVSNAGNISAGGLALILLPIISVFIIQAIVLTGFSGYLLEKKINL